MTAKKFTLNRDKTTPGTYRFTTKINERPMSLYLPKTWFSEEPESIMVTIESDEMLEE